MKAIVILSGGLDSTTLLYQCVKKGLDVEAMTFFYNQRHNREIEMASKTCQKLGVTQHIVNLSSLPAIQSALTDKNANIPHGHYEDETMKQTVVPNRNQVFLSIASMYAYSIQAELVAIGVHSGDHAIYPDCRKEFIMELEQVTNKGNAWFQPLRFYIPFIFLDKGDIVQKGIDLEVDFSLTQTCYEGTEKPCNECGSCVERRQAFAKNDIQDPLLVHC